MKQWYERQGHLIVKEYVEPGNTATDDKRPVFEDMIHDAQKKAAPLQMIVVHSFSPFFRDEIEATLYQRKLKKLGVKLALITQQTSDDPSGEIHVPETKGRRIK